MTALQNGIIKLIRSALTGEKQEMPDGFSLSDGIAVAKKHQIINLVYYGAINCGYSTEDPALINVFNTICGNISRNERQTFEYGRISESFKEKGIDHIPLKGIELRDFYPKQDMRTMGDIDILIKQEQYDAIKDVMTGLGYTEVNESNHEHIWKNNSMLIELHKRLIPSYNKDYYSYFGEGWQLAHPGKDDPHLCSMSDEDNYIYVFSHFAKHYRDGGIGIRHLVDLWVCRKRFKDIDMSYIEDALGKLHLKEFYKNVSITLDALFEDGPISDMTEVIAEYIFESGPYGTRMRQLISSRIKNAGGTKTGEAMSVIFLPLENMKLEFPVLKKIPVLLPVFWVVRGVRTVFFRKGKIKKNVQKLSLVKDENVREYNKFLNYVGLSFYKK